MSTNNQISPMQFCSNTSFTLPKNPEDLHPSKMDLDFLDCLGRKKSHLISEEIGICPKNHLIRSIMESVINLEVRKE